MFTNVEFSGLAALSGESSDMAGVYGSVLALQSPQQLPRAVAAWKKSSSSLRVEARLATLPRGWTGLACRRGGRRVELRATGARKSESSEDGDLKKTEEAAAAAAAAAESPVEKEGAAEEGRARVEDGGLKPSASERKRIEWARALMLCCYMGIQGFMFAGLDTCLF